TSTTNATSTKLGAGVLAIVGKDKSTVDQFNQIVDRAKRTYKQQKRPFPAVGSPDFKTLTGQIMNYLVERSELEQKADELGVKVTAAQVQAQIDKIKKQRGWSEQRLQQELKKTGITDADLRDTLRANLISEGLYNKVTAKVKVTDTEAKLYYDQHKSQYTTPASRRVRHILVKKKDLAEKLYKQLVANKGATFAALAKKYSIDPGSKNTGGEYTDTKGTFDPAFEKVAFSLKTHEIGKPVKSQFGWHIIQALGPVVPQKVSPFPKEKSNITQQLLNDKKRQTFQTWFLAMKKEFQPTLRFAPGYELPSTATAPTTTASTAPTTTG